jgi:hypothetical protein
MNKHTVSIIIFCNFLRFAILGVENIGMAHGLNVNLHLHHGHMKGT